jgi:multidrug efflux pump
MFSRFFIDRPIFASVLSIVITLAGGIAAFQLPLAQYPPVTPPTVQFDCNYPGASAQVVAQTVAAPIEQQVNGVENMMYMSSQCTSDGSYTLTVTFKTGMDLNLAQVLVQNRLALAMPQLPSVVRQAGVTTRKRSPEILMTVSLNSPPTAEEPNGRYDQLYLSNYALMKVRDELSRLPGISEIIVFGQRDYSMRIWLDPDKLAVRNLTVTDVIGAVREQNVAIAPGQIGQPPSTTGQPLQIPLSLLGRLRDPDEFAEIIVRTTPDGRKIRIRDLGHVELSAKSHDVSNRFDMKPTVGLAVFQLADANALATADMVKTKVEELARDFPEGMIYEIGYDTTPFIRESIIEVFKALRDAIILVSIVVLVFLQGWRPAIIPLLAVPVAIIGTFGVMAAFGFSINNLTLFGLVLAIGIVVDDAIVVVESVEHHIEHGLSARAAALKAMDEVSGPVIAVGLVLSAVFIPCAFLTGIVGQFFRQFALTIAVSTIISTFNSLTLSPALAALLLRPRNARPDLLTRNLNLLLGWLFGAFNWGFKRSTGAYTNAVGKLLRVPALVLVVYGGLVLLTWWSFGQLPTGFIPTQDKGYLVASVQLPDSSSVLRTRDVIAKLEKIALETEGVKNVNSVAGNSFMLSAYGSNFGSMFIILKGFDQRKSDELYADEILKKLKDRYADEVPEAIVNIFPPPAVSGLGRAGGFKMMVEDRGDVGLTELQAHTDNLVEKGNDQKDRVSGLFTVYNANSPQLFADVDREKCLKAGVSLGDVFSTLQAYLGSLYVNDFNKFGRTWQVIIQADQKFRAEVDDVRKLRVRNAKGQMVPLGSLATVRMVGGPLVLTRYNMYPAAGIQGNAAKGISTGQALEAMEALARREFPRSVSFEWTEMAYIERLAANTGMVVFGLSVVFVFLVLAALYESWSLPLAVILVVPMCVLSSLAGVWFAKMDINVFTQIGFVVLIGLASKNAILIVEFAKARREEGVDRRGATLHACELRLRPIMMTSFAFILGVLPLVAAHGAGAEMRRTLGTAVFSGMLGVTFFGILLTPVFFFVIDRAAAMHLFSSGLLREASDLVLEILSLRIVKRLFRALPARSDAKKSDPPGQPTEPIAAIDNEQPEEKKGSATDRHR